MFRDHIWKKGLAKNSIKHRLDVAKACINKAQITNISRTKDMLLPNYSIADFKFKVGKKDVKKVLPLNPEDQEIILKVAIDYSNK